MGFADEVTGLGAKGLATDPVAFDDCGRISDELGRLERFDLGVFIPGIADVGRFALAFEILFVGIFVAPTLADPGRVEDTVEREDVTGRDDVGIEDVGREDVGRPDVGRCEENKVFLGSEIFDPVNLSE